MRFNYVKMSDALQSRSEAITSLVLAAGLRWPFVTVPHFEIRGERAKQETLSETFGFAPIVETKDKQDWETYSVQKQAWLLEGRGVDVDGQDANLVPERAVIPTSITYMDPNETGSILPYPDTVSPGTPDTPFVVNWQISPVPALTTTINLNLRSSNLYRHLIQVMLDTREGVLSDFVDLGPKYETIILDDQHEQLHQDFVGTNDGKYFAAKDRPHSITVTPIFDKFSNATKKVVGMLYTVLPWDWQLADLLPEGTEKVHVVLDNSCGTTFTYEVQGPRAIYLGPGDLHQPEFDHAVVMSAFTTRPIIKEYDPRSTGATVQVGGNNFTICEYMVRIYPTKAMRATFDSGRPETFAIIMAAIFLVTGMVFLIFVRYVQQRQDMVMATAIRTSAIVSSLFPANVRERIMKDAEEQGRMDLLGGKSRGGNWRLKAGKDALGPKSKLEDFIGVEAGGESHGDGVGIIGDGGHDAFKSKPIADLFPDGRFKEEVCVVVVAVG